jgi:hypothetical protein
MIIKRIRESALRKRRSLHRIEAVVKALTTYAIDAKPDLLETLARESRAANYVLDVGELGIEPGEKVEFHGTRNLIGDSLIQHQQQMLSACILVPDATDPIEHYVISWREGEHPSRKEIEEVVSIFSVEMGYERSQVVWAVHSNTAQWHLHIVASRINLLQGKVVTPGDGWDIDRLHQVLALVEDRQGWSSERNAIYVAKEGVVFDRETMRIVRRADGSRDGCYKRKAKPPEKGQAPEHDKILQALRGATSWRDLHYRLAREGAAYLAKGSGAEIRLDGQRMPASAFGREFVFRKMEARLGPYEPDVVRERDPHELYQAHLRDERARLRDALNAALDELRRRRALALKDVRRREQSQFRQAIAEERIQLAFDQVEKRIKHEFDLVRRTIATSYLNRERWYKADMPPALTVNLPEIVYAGTDPRGRVLAGEHEFTVYQHDAGTDYLDRSGTRAVTDYGPVLIVHHVDAKAVEVALFLASTRADTIEVAGSAQFLDACRKVAVERGYNVVGPDGISLGRIEPVVSPQRGRLATANATDRQAHVPQSSPGRNTEMGGSQMTSGKRSQEPQLSDPSDPKPPAPEVGSDQGLSEVSAEFWRRAGKGTRSGIG